MKTYAYYTFSDSRFGLNMGSRSCNRLPIIINCFGHNYGEHPFTTDNVEGRDDYYLMYITSGNIHYNFNGRAETLSSGTVVVFPPHYRYRYTSEKNDGAQYFWVHFTGSAIPELLTEYGLGSLPFYKPLGTAFEVMQYGQKMADTFIKNGQTRDLSLGVEFNELLLYLAKAVFPDKVEQNALEKSIFYIHKHYTEYLNVPFLASLDGLSVSRYNFLFKKHIGVPPTEYIAKMRIDAACKLLYETDLSISQIGEAVGYPDSRFFCKRFKVFTGLTPTEHRKQYAKSPNRT